MFEGLYFLEVSINEVNWLRKPDFHKHAGYANQKCYSWTAKMSAKLKNSSTES